MLLRGTQDEERLFHLFEIVLDCCGLLYWYEVTDRETATVRKVCLNVHCFVWVADVRTARNWWTGDGHCKLLS